MIELPLPVLEEKVLPFVYEYFQALERVTGRGVYLIFLGTLGLTLLAANNLWGFDFLGVVSGGFTLFIGIITTIVGVTADRALASVRGKIESEDDARLAFKANDADKNGYLDIDELSHLAGELGSALNKVQLTAILKSLDSDGNGQVDEEEFIRWWKGSDSPAQADDTKIPAAVTALKAHSRLATKGYSGLRIANTLGGVGILIGGLLGFYVALHLIFDGESAFGLDQLVLLGTNFWLATFGLLTILLELKSYICGVRVNAFIERNCMFLDLVLGRAILYFFAGTLGIALYQPDLDYILLISIFAGLGMIALAILNLITGLAFNQRLGSLRQALVTGGDNANSNSLAFDRVDQNHDGILDMDELSVFCKNNGIELDHRQWELLLARLDRDGDGQVNLEEFTRWWSQRDL